MIERGHTKEKNEEKGADEGQNERNRLSKKFCSTNIKKLPRAYDSLSPALHQPREDRVNYCLIKDEKFVED
jgi:hypothetical protein